MPDKPAKFDPNKHHRKSVRLPGYDYSQTGAYFVTIVSFQRECIFGEIINEEMVLNDFGRIADECWRAIPEHFPFVELGAHVVMPNHVHGIIMITDGRGTIYRAPTIERAPTTEHVPTIERAPTTERVPTVERAPTTEQFGKPTAGSLPTIVRTYKAAVTRLIGREHNATGIWQRNYHEHIIRNEREMGSIWGYIEANPIHWQDDEENR